MCKYTHITLLDYLPMITGTVFMSHHSTCKVILMVGGWLTSQGYVDIVESYDPLTSQRKILTPLPKPLYGHGLVVLGRTIMRNHY